MPLTFGEVRKLISSYAGKAGKCPSAEETSIFARQVMEYLLYSGSQAGVRKVCVYAVKGCFALPPEVEIPIKVKINHRVAEVHNKWFSFHSVNEDFERCHTAGEVLIEDGAQTPIAYQLPQGGSIIGVLGTCEESEDSFVSVEGKDQTGRVIYTMFNGEQISGEKFRIKKGELRFGKVHFGEITSLLKSKTNGYVGLFAVNPTTGAQKFLADYSPMEEKPLYRQFKITTRDCPPIVHISMLCRVKLKDNYHDNDITFFDNSLAITLAAQRIQSETNNDANVANYKRQAVEDILEKEAGYKKISGNPVDVFWPLSGGSIRNIC